MRAIEDTASYNDLVYLLGQGGDAGEVETLLLDIYMQDLARTPLYNRFERDTGTKLRALSVPRTELRTLLRDYVTPLIKTAPVHPSCHGGEQGWSPKTSLQWHAGCRALFTFDLENAFENFPAEAVYRTFEQTLGTDEPLTSFLTEICTVPYGERRGLPQGAPHSMALFNRALAGLDARIAGHAGMRAMRYTRWVDDLTLSSQVRMPVSEFMGSLWLVEPHLPVAMHKVFYQDGPEQYALGCTLADGEVFRGVARKPEALDVRQYMCKKW